MGEGFIVRRGGGGQQTVKPIYNSLTEAGFTSLTLSVTNDSNSEATLYYSVVNTEPAPDQAGTFDTEFAGQETKDITITGLTAGTTYTVYLKAIAVGEFPSETVIVPDLTTGVAMNATGGTLNTYTSGGTTYRSHTFTGNGTFQVTQLSNMGSTFNQVEYLVVAGGGAGGSEGGGQNVPGGGGAGGFRTGTLTMTTGNKTVTVGAGGAMGQNGFNSVFDSITSTGGGRGGYEIAGSSGYAQPGGSGGGANYVNPSNFGTGIAGQGNNGGSGGSSANNVYAAGGGGGAGAVGGNAGVNSGRGGNGGNGLQNSLRTGSNIYYAGGGGGGAWVGANGCSVGGLGGGGNGGSNISGCNSFSTAQAGGVNTGGGGGAGYTTNGFSKGGGSGIVVVRYEIAPTV